MQDLSEKRFVVTGGSSGIGDACVEAIRTRGGEVVVFDRNPPKDSAVTYVAVDLTDPAAIAKAVEQVADPVDGLLNVAGVAGTAPASLLYAVNFLAVRELALRFAERLRPGGSIVNVASLAGAQWQRHIRELTPLLETSSFAEGREWLAGNELGIDEYTLSKEAVIYFTLKNALEFSLEKSVRMNVVSPGPVETPLTVEFQKAAEKLGAEGVSNPVGRRGTAAEIAAAVVFIASGEANWVVGQHLIVDGGLSSSWPVANASPF